MSRPAPLVVSEEVTRIVAGLTKAQRDLLTSKAPSCIDTYPPFIRLRSLGLLVGSYGKFGSHVIRLTPLGEHVCAALRLAQGSDRGEGQ